MQGAFRTALVMAAGIGASRALGSLWEHKTERPAPKDPDRPEVSWSEALLWGASAGLLAGVVKTVVRSNTKSGYGK